MNIADRLAGGLGRRDQEPNRQLATALVESANPADIDELFNLITNGTKRQKHDTIAVIYTIAALNPALLIPQIDKLFTLLKARNNRVIWGTLIALDTLCDHAPKPMMAHLNDILDAADRSSVVAKDKTMSILSKLNGHAPFHAIVTPVLMQRLRNAAINQFPMYAEMAATTLAPADIPDFIAILTQRKITMPYPAKIKRIDKLIHSLGTLAS